MFDENEGSGQLVPAVAYADDAVPFLVGNEELSLPLRSELNRLFTLQSNQINQLKTQLEEHAREIKLTRIACEVNFIIEDAQTQSLILQVNEFQQRIQSHPNSQALTQLTMGLVKTLRAHCNALIPLASGFYRPHTTASEAIEIGHASSHVLGHGVHHIKIFHHHANKISMSLPVIGLVATLYDVWHEHHVIHEAEEAFGKLGLYSDSQRDVLYRYVVSCAIVTFASSFEGKSLSQCHAKILFEIFACLPKLHECEAIDGLANAWSQFTNHAIQQSGVIMPSSTQSMQPFIYTKEQLSIAWKVQQIFLDTTESTVQEHLALPQLTNFLHDLHRRIYQDVLKPYDTLANKNAFEGFFTFYSSEQLKLVKKYQSYFIRALKVIKNELTALEAADDLTYTLQLNLINTCLYANLNAMGLAMKWHYAQGLFAEIAAVSPRLSCTPCPLSETSNGSLTIVSIEGLLAEAKARTEKAEDRAEKADARVITVLEMLKNQAKKSPTTSSPATQGMFAHATQPASLDYRLSQLPIDEQFTLESKVLYVTNMEAIQAGTTKQLHYALMNSSNQRVDGTLTVGEIHQKGGHIFDKPITFDQFEPCLKTMLKLITDKDELSLVQQTPVSTSL